MKKSYFFLLAAMLMCQSSLMAQPSITVPVDGQYYSIVQATGFFLARNLNAEAPTIQTPTGNWDQVFVFEPVAGEDGTFYIKNVYDDDYLVRTGANAWTMGWVKDVTTIATPANGKYQIVSIAGTSDYIQIKNLGSGSMLGSDNATAGSAVYGNKNGTTDNKYQWKIKEYSNDVDKDALLLKLTEANAIYSSTSAGTGSDQYPAANRTALYNAITDAQEVYDDAQATQTEVNEELARLSDALDAYRASVYPFQPDVTKTFYVVHSSNYYFTNGGIIAAADWTPNQHFQFVAVQGKPNVYNIKNVATGKFMTRDVGPVGGPYTYFWGVKWNDDATSEFSEFQIKSTGTGFYTIIGIVTVTNSNGGTENSCLGTDSNDANSGVYLNKSGNDGKHYWKFQDITLVEVNKSVLEEAIAAASEFLANAVRGDGSDQYPAAEYDAFVAAKNAAEIVFADAAATQTQVGDATLALNNALTAVIAAVNPFQPDLTKTYYIQHYSGFYFGEYSDETNANTPAVFSNSQSTTQQFQFVATDVQGEYNIKILSLNKYLTRLNIPLAEEGRFDDYGLTWGDDNTTDFAKFIIKKVVNQDWHTIKCITAGGQRTTSYVGANDNAPVAEFDGIYVDKNGSSTFHYWKITDVEALAVKQNTTSNAYVFTGNNVLTVKNLKGNNRINVYSVTGQLIASSVQSSNEYTQTLSTGTYIVVVNGDSP
ncbi:MAG: DUF6383 domain-containing protein, partial [Paludibacter sp.]|nr:DUF6383 domain-containing protein [Paludibacter sp.]